MRRTLTVLMLLTASATIAACEYKSQTVERQPAATTTVAAPAASTTYVTPTGSATTVTTPAAPAATTVYTR